MEHNETFPKVGPSEEWKLFWTGWQGSIASISMLWVSDQEHRLGSSVQNNPTAAGNAKAIHLEFIIKYLHILTYWPRGSLHHYWTLQADRTDADGGVYDSVCNTG